MESKLIEAVQMYPCLFDKNKRDYRNKKQKEEAWASVAEETGETGNHHLSCLQQTFNILMAIKTSKIFELFLPLLLLLNF